MVSLLSIVKTGRFQLKRALLDTGNASICQICQYKNTFIRLPCPYNTKGVYLGERYIEAVFRHYRRGHISVEQAADYLDAKTKNVPKIEEWLFQRGAGA